MPTYTNATYGGKSHILQNDQIRVEVHNRETGWAWVEIYTPENKLMGVMPYLGGVEDNPGGERGNAAIFRRLESPDVQEEHTDLGDSLLFHVHSLTSHDLAKGSFVEYMTDPNEHPLMQGTIRLTLEHSRPVLHLDYNLTWMGNNGFVFMRGPWLLAGADSYGSHKTDAIFPGIEWLRRDEWSSSHNYMLPPLSERTAPHPFKVTAPVMAVSHEGDGIGLAWDPGYPLVARRPMSVQYYPQPVFSSPDAVNHADDHLMGLMLPTAAATGLENNVYPKTVTPFPLNSTISMRAEIFLVKGCSLDVLSDWVIRHGLPQPPAPRRSMEEMLDFIVQNYDGHLWVDTEETKGWVLRLEKDMARGKFSVSEPVFLERYLQKYPDGRFSVSLREKLNLAMESQPDFGRSIRDPFRLLKMDENHLRSYGEGLLSIQQEDGRFLFDPTDKRSATYYKPDIVHWPFSENTYKELCTIGDTSLETNVISALHLLLIARQTGEERFLEAAKRALDFCLDMQVADGGDSWETPFHSPNLLAAGHASIAYELAFRACGKDIYRAKAIYWLRSFLIFTHLWEPMGVKDLYCTKPCLCATDWNTTSWVDTHVEWEIIQSLALAGEFGIDWDEVDPDIDWHQYARGIVHAVSHWILDRSRAKELPYDIDLEKGNVDGLFADAHDPLTGECFGWQVMPDYLANLIMDIQEWR